MFMIKRSCDQCGKDTTDAHGDATLSDHRLHGEKHFCDMRCLKAWVVSNVEPVEEVKAA